MKKELTYFNISYKDEHISYFTKDELKVIDRMLNYSPKPAKDEDDRSLPIKSMIKGLEYGNYFHLFFVHNGFYSMYKHLFRILYLGTFATYPSDTGKIYLKTKNNITMEKRHLSSVVFDNLEDRDRQRTVKYMFDNQIIFVDERGKLYINKNYIVKGKITQIYSEEGNRSDLMVRVFNDTIERLYLISDPKQHKLLDTLVKILPYINVNLNSVCTPEDVNKLEDVKFLTFSELSEELGMGYNNSSKLRKLLMSIEANGKNLVGVFTTANSEIIKINPMLFYKGNNSNCLEDLHNDFNKKN